MKLMHQAKLAKSFKELSDDNNLILCARARENAEGTMMMIGGGGNDVMAMACQICASIFVRYQDQLKEDVSFEDYLEDTVKGIRIAYEDLLDKSNYADWSNLMKEDE